MVVVVVVGGGGECEKARAGPACLPAASKWCVIIWIISASELNASTDPRFDIKRLMGMY